MSKEKETTKLEAEVLEKRVAPLAIINQDSVDDQEPVDGPDPAVDGPTTGGGGNPPIVDRTR